jgi:hypothetical protein
VVNSIGTTYSNVVSVPIENITYIYNHTSPLIPQVAPTGLTLHGQSRIHHEKVFTPCRRCPQNIPRSPCPRCVVVARRMTDTQPLLNDRYCPQASLILREWVQDSHYLAKGNLPSYLIVGVLLQNSKLHKGNAESKIQLAYHLLRLL